MFDIFDLPIFLMEFDAEFQMQEALSSCFCDLGCGIRSDRYWYDEERKTVEIWLVSWLSFDLLILIVCLILVCSLIVCLISCLQRGQRFGDLLAIGSLIESAKWFHSRWMIERVSKLKFHLIYSCCSWLFWVYFIRIRNSSDLYVWSIRDLRVNM